MRKDAGFGFYCILGQSGLYLSSKTWRPLRIVYIVPILSDNMGDYERSYQVQGVITRQTTGAGRSIRV
jgi:hypothetical protein